MGIKLMIEVRSLTKTYGKKQQTFTALKDIHFQVADGETVAIVGKSGSGKSTLMHVISGLDHASSGTITVDGREIAGMKPKAMDSFRAHYIGFIFQSFFIQANETCFDNVALPLEINQVSGKERKRLVNEALAQVELSEKAQVKAGNLSGGQKQRLAIARAIVNKPKLLFADEPTGNLDSKTSEVIEDLLFGLNKRLGCTLIIVTHDEELAAHCNRQIYLKDGVIVRDSTGTSIAKSGGSK